MNLQLDVCITLHALIIFQNMHFADGLFWNYPYIKGMSKRPDTVFINPLLTQMQMFLANFAVLSWSLGIPCVVLSDYNWLSAELFLF